MSEIITSVPLISGAHFPRGSLGISIFLTLAAEPMGWGLSGGPHPHTSASYHVMVPRG